MSYFRHLFAFARQGGRVQGPSVAGQLLPQNKRPTSAPSQRPDLPESSSDPADTWAGEPATKHETAAATPSVSPAGRVGAANHGYPAHGLMPSGSNLQLHDQADPGRWGVPGGSVFRPRPLQMPVGTVASGGNAGRGGGGSGRRAVSVASSPMSGGSYSSTESLRLARVSSNASVDVEVRLNWRGVVESRVDVLFVVGLGARRLPYSRGFTYLRDFIVECCRQYAEDVSSQRVLAHFTVPSSPIT